MGTQRPSGSTEPCGGSADPWGYDVHCEVQSGPFPGVEAGGSAGSRLPAGWSIDSFYLWRPSEPGIAPDQRIPCDPATGENLAAGTYDDDESSWPGLRGVVWIRDATGRVTATVGQCFGDGAPLPDWLPPTRGEIEAALAAAPWPASTTGVDPVVEGLTGLETRFWSTTPAAQPISVTVGNATVVGTARPLVHRWQTGDGAVVTAAHGGSPDAPAATHVYDVKDGYVIVLEIEWQADVEVVTALPGGGELRFHQDPPLAPVTVAGSRDYRVVEVRSVLVPNAP